MPVTRERFASGRTDQQSKEQMTRNRDRLEAAEQAFQPTAEQSAAFQTLPKPLNVLAIGEDWRGDVIANFPVLAKLAEATGKLNVRIFLRDQREDLINQCLKQGQFTSIPVVVFFDDDFAELGHFIERPDSVTELRARKRQELFAQHPEFGDPSAPPDQLPEDVRARLPAALQALRDETVGFANGEVVKALSQIVAKAA